MKRGENYHAMSMRIESASLDALKLKKLEQSLSRLWDVNAFTLGEFCALDDMILRRLIKAQLLQN